MSMEVISARSALLSNYEVLALLRELESDQLVRQKTALRIKKEEEEALATQHAQTMLEEVSANLRTVEFEAIQYLTADHQPSKTQTAESIASLGRALNAYDLTKAEKLQIVNLVPSEAVELYVIVEEIEDRLGDKMEDILNLVRDNMAAAKPSLAASQAAASQSAGDSVTFVTKESRSGWARNEREGELSEEFDNFGAGAGVEGDLEMEDDDDI